MSARPLWQIIHERFDPERPVRDPAWRVERARSPVPEIDKLLDMPFGVPRALMTGTFGTGKTTELYRIAEMRRGRDFVVFLPLDQHLDETVGEAGAVEHVSAWEICFLAALAILRSAEEMLGFTLPDAHKKALAETWRALAAATGAAGTDSNPQVDVAKLAKQMLVLASGTAAAAAGPVGAGAAVGLQVLGAVADAGRWSLPFGLRKRALPDQDKQVRNLLDTVNTIIGLVQQRAARVVLIIDGLDRIKKVEQAKALFVDSNMIGQLACRMLVAGPFALRHHPALTAVSPAYSLVTPLANEPVLLQSDPEQHGPGIPFFTAVFQKRTADLGERGRALVTRAQLDRLAYYSGGRLRELVALVRRAAEHAWSDDVPSLTDPIVNSVIDERRRFRETGLHRGHLRVLQSIAEDPEHKLPDDPLIEDLLEYGALLPYPNESEWYYPHPLLMMHWIRPVSGGSASSG